MITMRKFTTGAAAAFLAAGLSGCNESLPAPTPYTTVTIALTTPNTDDGAMLMVFTGLALSDVQASSAAYQVFWRVAGPSETRVIVVGDIVGGPVLTARAAGRATALTGTVTEVSTRGDQLRSTTTGYSLTANN